MLQRSDFNRARVEALAAASGVAVAGEAALAASRAAALSGRWARDLWVFGYGSLMWNPAMSFVESRVARLDGWQRSFCISLSGGRGSPDRPGLMCALIPSGSCSGVAFRIAADEVDSETAIMWNREMAFGAYEPSFVPVTIDGATVDALTFTADASRVVRLSIGDQARRIAYAEGVLGTNREYLFRLGEALSAANLTDLYITALAHHVRTILEDQR